MSSRSCKIYDCTQKGKVICYAPRDLTKTGEELPEFGMRGIRNYLGNGKVPLLPVWKGIYIGN